MVRRWWQRPGIVLPLVFVLTIPAVTPRLYAADEIEYYAFLRSLWFDGDVSFDNEYREFWTRGVTTDQLFYDTFIAAETVTGLRPSFATIGCAIMWAPFYAVADGSVRVARLFGADVAADGYSQPYISAVTYGSAVYGALALLVSAGLARRLTGGGAWAALAVGLGTPLVFYMYIAPGMSHACSAFLVAVFVWSWLQVRVRWTVPGVAGLAGLGALMAMVREQDAFLVVVPAVDYVLDLGAGAAPWTSRIRNGLTRLGVATLAFAVAFLPQALAYLALNGRVGPSPVVENKMNWLAPWALQVLVSTEHGWFFWTPLVPLALLGLIGMATIADPQRPDARRLGRLLLLGVATQIYVSGSVLSWTLAGAFGQRRFVALTVALVVGLAWWTTSLGRPIARRALAVVVALTIWWNLGLIFQFGAGLMDRQRLDLGPNTRMTFFELPGRVPGLAYRYLFDRSSFYRSSPD